MAEKSANCLVCNKSVYPRTLSSLHLYITIVTNFLAFFRLIFLKIFLQIYSPVYKEYSYVVPSCFAAAGPAQEYGGPGGGDPPPTQGLLQHIQAQQHERLLQR